MRDVLFRWPPASTLGSKVAKERFYEQGTVSAAVRQKFVSEVQRITWAHKLAENTVNLPGNASVPEIQIFQIAVKGHDLSDHVLAAIDTAISFPIIFEITRDLNGGQVRMTAAHKQIGAGRPKLSQYFSTEWQASNVVRIPLPASINLPGLYAALLEPLMEIAVRPGEGMSEVAERLRIVNKLKREIAALERKLKSERQLNRKIEIRRAIKTKQTELEQQR